ncbi:hypothetical protein EV190_10758 [Actinorugispora endophytica]|uniref:DDE family transposase n=1 Tax=Actinorugispora endophytica TaxID=1605990 RepID=A0A4V3D8M2_9ACTN|nr:hypothetical protein EV190_10758 [Actinorugispora endophytica]
MIPLNNVAFPHARQVLQIVRKRRTRHQPRYRSETVYALTVLQAHQAGGADLARYIREHWSVENKSHHVHDTTFTEDACRVRVGSAPQVPARLRNLLIGVFRHYGYANIAYAHREHTNPNTALTLLFRPKPQTRT